MNRLPYVLSGSGHVVYLQLQNSLNMLSNWRKGRYSVLIHFILFVVIASAIVRTGLLMLSWPKASFGVTGIIKIYGTGFVFDFGVALFFSLLYALYLLVFPSKWSNSRLNRVLTYTGFFISTLILMFSFFAEFTFWGEFESRFNFIAVDYLIYTYEVVNNINESYPLPLLIGGMLLVTGLLTWLFTRRGYFRFSFTATSNLKERILFSGLIIVGVLLYGTQISNTLAEGSANRYQNELSKAGVYSFFAAFKNNELNYEHFYKLIDQKKAFEIVRQQLSDSSVQFQKEGNSILRTIHEGDSAQLPNVIMITIESFSADFMERFGNQQHITPFLDSLAGKSLLFTRLYATGTRTVRGMEALSLAVPPTPGSSIVRRPGNEDLTTIGQIFRAKGYATSFFYGGDGYFDNMNHYFGNNGYAVTDRGRNLVVQDELKAGRTRIADSLVRFENAWGISDEDLYQAVIRDADTKHQQGKRFYDFVMTTSNHRPYTFPSGTIDLPSGSGREAAVKYTDYAIRQFIHSIQSKPWFKNTVVILVADHCASSAGKNEIDISKYHIPALVYHLPVAHPDSISVMCSQIDIYPTLFHLLGWTYQSNLYGQNVLKAGYQPRVLLGTYQKLAYLKQDQLVILSPQQKAETYRYDPVGNRQIPEKIKDEVIQEAIANYQSAYYLFKSGGLKNQQK